MQYPAGSTNARITRIWQTGLSQLRGTIRRIRDRGVRPDLVSACDVPGCRAGWTRFRAGGFSSLAVGLPLPSGLLWLVSRMEGLQAGGRSGDLDSPGASA